MRSCRFLTVLVLLAVLMSNVVSGVSAQEKGGQSILNKSASQIEEVDLEQFVDLIFAWQVTVPQVKMLYERLTRPNSKPLRTSYSLGLPARQTASPFWSRVLESMLHLE